MKNGKLFFIAIIFLVSFLCISAASAADDAASDIIADANEGAVLEESIDDAVLEDGVNDELESSDEISLDSADEESKLSETSTGTFTDLNNDINGNDNTTIYLTRNYKRTSNSEPCTEINRAVTIYGNGITIDGNGGFNPFRICSSDVEINDINFINCYGSGAIQINGTVHDIVIANCNFTQNSAGGQGGAVYVGIRCSNVLFENCTFVKNSAYGQGGAIYVANHCTNVHMNNCTFIQNSADIQGGAIYVGPSSSADSNNCTFMFNTASQYPDQFNGNLYDCIYIDAATLRASDFTTTAYSGEKLPFNVTATAGGQEKAFNVYTTIKLSRYGAVIGTYHALSAEGWAVDLDAGDYDVTFGIEGSPVANVTVKLSVQKIAAEITPSKDQMDLFVGDSSKVGCSLRPDDASGDINFTSSNPGVVTVDSAGNIKAVGAGTATITISLSSSNYEAKDATVTITVSKKDSQITASAKSYKFEDKTKTYTVTLKDKKGNVLKNKKVTLKVGGATYTATTNNKGVATFKLNKLTKQGTYTAVISYAGDNAYNKASRNAKLTVKAPAWKTVSKGSKDKAMVKKIQKALKKNGYYLSYKGRYLKIDGLFHKYTEMAVKQFQKAKKLKVTGKVDYATAKKLKLI